MKRIERLQQIRRSLGSGGVSIGSWIQLPSASVAEIMGQAGYDWIAVDLEHGAISLHQLPDLFRALELGGTLPMARLSEGSPTACKQALDAGAGGVIVPMVESAEQLAGTVAACRWPPAGIRGVGFSRANLFGRRFEAYSAEAQAPLLVAMIEHSRAVERIDEILQVDGLDAILIGPYDLSASLGLTGQFDAPEFVTTMDRIRVQCAARSVPCGVHVVQPEPVMLKLRLQEGYRFLAYAIDSVFLTKSSGNPLSPAD